MSASGNRSTAVSQPAPTVPDDAAARARPQHLFGAFQRWEQLLLGAAVLASGVLVYAALGDVVLALGAALGLVLIAAGAVLVRQLADAGPTEPVRAGMDWVLLRDLADQDGIGISVTDRAGRMVCANALYGSWFPASNVPPGLALDGDGRDRLTTAGRIAWRDGLGKAAALSWQGLQLDAEVVRSGRADDYLLWRFRPVVAVDRAVQAAHLLGGKDGRALGQAGIMAALVSAEGRIQAANSAFLLRAGGSAQAILNGRDVAALIRIDENGALFFEREGEKATPLRLFQLPLGSGDASPHLLALVDEDGGPAERGVALSYIESLLTLLPFGLAMVDRDGRFLFANAAFRHAAGLGEARLPLYPGDLVAAEDKTAIGDAVRRYATGQQLAGDIVVRLKHQPDDPVMIGLAGVRGMGQAAVLLSMKDNGEEHALKRQVAQASKMQAVGQLAGGVAHDFNNILTAIIGHVDLMLMRQMPGDSDYDDLQQVRSNALRAASLTRQLLAFSRQQTLRPQILQLADIISEVSSLLTRLIGEKIKLVVSHGRGVGAVRADPSQLEQVIVNLAVNARDAILAHNPDGGMLKIETFAMPAAQVRKLGNAILPNADYSVLRISDSGSGIPPDILPKIFEPFFTTKDVGKGTGLGLSTVYGIVKQSDGYIFAESPARTGSKAAAASPPAQPQTQAQLQTPAQPPAPGSSFTIYLPVHSAAAGDAQTQARAGQPARPDTPRTEWGSGTILLVEDEDMVRAVAERALTRAGYSVICAENGEAAMEQLGSIDQLDLLLTDVVMPMMDGPELAGKLRAMRPDVPILFMSGYAEEQLRQSITLPRVGFLPKPFSVTQLADAVSKALAISPP